MDDYEKFLMPPDDGSGLDPLVHYAKVVAMPEHKHLAEGRPRVAFLLREDPKICQCKVELGSVHMPKVQGSLKDVFTWSLQRLLGYMPDYLMILDRDYWMASSPALREILIFHEACHMVQKTNKDGDPSYNDDGLPVWGLLGHDLEEFDAVVRRYGAYRSDVASFLAAAQEGESNIRGRRK